MTNDGSQLYTAKILCPAGKSTGEYKNWLNVQYEKPVEFSGKIGSYNWFEDIRSWHYAPTDESVLNASNDEFSDAKQKELQNWIENAVYKEVSNVGQEFVTVRWVLTEKEIGTKKVRLVARGFQEDTSKFLVDSPTCSKEIRRVFLCILTYFQWLLHSLDVKTAFLQGKQINRNVFLKPPPEAATKSPWKLQKCVYGLGYAARKWYDKLLSFFVENGLLQSKLAKAFFFLESKDGLGGAICIHVDDMFYRGTQRFHEEIMTKFKERFTVGRQEVSNFTHLGVFMRQDIARRSDITKWIYRYLTGKLRSHRRDQVESDYGKIRVDCLPDETVYLFPS